jgi:hypothetical protein
VASAPSWVGGALFIDLTFDTDFGWDTMEPIPGRLVYVVGWLPLSGSYITIERFCTGLHSTLNFTISRRQRRLYQAKGLDIQRWEAAADEGNALRKETKAVVAEYDVDWDEQADEHGHKVIKALRKREMEGMGKSWGKSKKQDNDDDDTFSATRPPMAVYRHTDES